MDKQVKNRVKQAMDQLSISAYAIAKSCSINERTIYEQTNGSSKIGTSVLAALLAYCPQLSAEWLLRGAGDMLISSVVPTERTPRDDRETTEQITKDQPRTNQGSTKDEPTTEDSSDAAAAYIEKIEQLQAELEQQKEFNALQKEYVIDLKERISEYQERVAELKDTIHELKKAHSSAIALHAKSV